MDLSFRLSAFNVFVGKGRYCKVIPSRYVSLLHVIGALFCDGEAIVFEV